MSLLGRQNYLWLRTTGGVVEHFCVDDKTSLYSPQSEQDSCGWLKSRLDGVSFLLLCMSPGGGSNNEIFSSPGNRRQRSQKTRDGQTLKLNNHPRDYQGSTVPISCFRKLQIVKGPYNLLFTFSSFSKKDHLLPHTNIIIGSRS